MPKASKAVAVTPEEFERAGGDPMKIPRLRAALEDGEARASAEWAAKESAANRPDWQDIAPEMTIAGMPCRPCSSGVLVILERIDHPAYRGADMTFEDVVVLLYVLCCPDLRAVVAQSRDGTIRDEATVWSFGVGVSDIKAAEADVNAWMAAAALQMELSGTGSDDAKKKPTG